jgi:hypothetical protein
MADLFGIAMSLGTISHLEQATVQAVATSVAEAQAYVRTQPVAHLDETGWREGCTRAWLWVAMTTWVTVFAVRLSRGAEVAQELLGERLPPERLRPNLRHHLRIASYDTMIPRANRSSATSR